MIDIDLKISAPSVIYLSSEFHYPDYDMILDASCETEKDKDFVNITCNHFGPLKIIVEKKEAQNIL